MRACLCVCTCSCLCDWLGAIACVSADSAVELYAVVFFFLFVLFWVFFSLPPSLSWSMTVADSQFTPPLAMLNLKVRASGGVCHALKKPAAVLFRVLPRPSAWPHSTAPALPHKHAPHPRSALRWPALPMTDCQPR